MKKLSWYCLIAFFSGFVFWACQNKPKGNKAKENSKEAPDVKALNLLQKNCFSCHNMKMVPGTRVAPPINMIRNHYWSEEITEEDFTQKMIYFIQNPTEANSIMPGAVRNFGLMPKQTFNEEDLKMITSYIFANDFESEEWLATYEAFKKTDKPKEDTLSYEDLGLQFANGTKSELGKNLLAAIQEKGAAGAVSFCNTRAIPLTDSMSKVYHASIKRVSDLPRNPQNVANEAENAYIQEMKAKMKEGAKPIAKMTEQNGKMVGYYPIETNKMCLTCHGEPGIGIDAATLTIIKKLYPNDKAIGYGENELRGIFVVEMDKRP